MKTFQIKSVLRESYQNQLEPQQTYDEWSSQELHEHQRAQQCIQFVSVPKEM